MIPVLLIAIIWRYAHNNKTLQHFTVVETDLKQSVIITGTIKAARRVELSFEQGGRVAWINQAIGSSVQKGETLAYLANGDLIADRDEAVAQVTNEQARFDELKRGQRPEERAVSEANVRTAEQSLVEAKNNLANQLHHAYATADSALRTKIDPLFDNPASNYPRFGLYPPGYNQLARIIDYRLRAEPAMVQWGEKAGLENAERALNIIENLAAEISLALSDLPNNLIIRELTLAEARLAIGNARAEVSTALTNILSAANHETTAKINLDLANQELALAIAKPTVEKITIQQSRVDEASARLKRADSRLEKTIIRAPFSGVVTRRQKEIGEAAAAGEPIIGLISTAGFEVKINVPEVEIAKIKTGQSAKIKLEALGNDQIMTAKVTSIDMGENIVDGVPTYETTLLLTRGNEQVRDGLTAEVTIITAQKRAIAIPIIAIKNHGDQTAVEKLTADGVTPTVIETGLRADSGLIEVLSGLSTNDKIVLPADDE